MNKLLCFSSVFYETLWLPQNVLDKIIHTSIVMNNSLQVQYQYLLFKIQATLATSDWIYRLHTNVCFLCLVNGGREQLTNILCSIKVSLI